MRDHDTNVEDGHMGPVTARYSRDKGGKGGRHMDDAALLARLTAEIEHPNATRLGHALVAMIAASELPPGQKLPPIRTVADALGMSPAAVGQSWKLLRTRGVIETNTRGGTTVIGPPRAQRPQRFTQLNETVRGTRVDLGRPLPDAALLPDLGGALVAVGRHNEGLNVSDPPPLTDRLRDAVARHWPFEADDVVAVHRGIDGVEHALMALVARGDAVAVEDPTVPRVLDILDRIGARVIPVGWQADGPDLRELLRALHAGAKVFVLQPNGHSPTGRSVSEAWVAEAATLIGRSEAHVIELDNFALLHPVRRTLGTYLPHATVLVEGYSHSHGPDIQVAVMGGSNEVIGRVVQQISYSHRWVSRVLQDALAVLLASDEASAFVRDAASEYQRRHARARAWFAARGFSLAPETSAPSLWIPVVDDAVVVERLAELGVGVLPGSVFERRRGGQRHIHVNAGLPFDVHLPYFLQIAEVASAATEQSLARRRERYRAEQTDGTRGQDGNSRARPSPRGYGE